jgi:hypothetical protein
LTCCFLAEQVLHQFLQVYGSFDWDAMCLTLQGPMPLADIAHSKGMRDELVTAAMCTWCGVKVWKLSILS